MEVLALALLDMRDDVSVFMERAGFVLNWIALLLLVMWTMVIDRLWYFLFEHKKYEARLLVEWRQRQEHISWFAHKHREDLIARARHHINTNYRLIESLVLLCPLLGLLGTVTGMIDVFHVLGITGGGDAKAMAGGVSRSTLPTLAGMVGALSGVVATTILQSMIKRANLRIEHMLDSMGEHANYAAAQPRAVTS